ncbi:MAG: M16 family metallopeptidase [Candidatus Zixiibacteriota bacterium]
MALRGVYKKAVLKNGIRVVTEKIGYVRSIAIGVWIDAGSRDEKSDERGVSHFIEHMLFKGTKKRSAKEIASSLESVGGALNGFTGREHTCYFARVLDEHLNIAIDVLADILKNSLLNPSDFQREKAVIISEIKDLEDSPADLAHDYLMNNIWPDHPLGRSIMGDTESILGMTKSKLIDFIKRNYVSPRVVIAASGNLNHQDLVGMIQEKFRFNQAAAAPQASQSTWETNPNRVVVNRETAQTHVSLGVPVFPYKDRRRYAALILSNILGGGMSSRLFQTIREELGLAYNIYTFVDFFEDTGVFGIYLGTHKKNTVRGVDLVLKEIKKVKKDSLSSQELSHAKYQLKGNLMLNLENTSNRMNRLARQELLLNKYVDLDETIDLINRVKKKEVVEVAAHLFDPDKLSAVILGPVGKRTVNQINWDSI